MRLQDDTWNHKPLGITHMRPALKVQRSTRDVGGVMLASHVHRSLCLIRGGGQSSACYWCLSFWVSGGARWQHEIAMHGRPYVWLDQNKALKGSQMEIVLMSLPHCILSLLGVITGSLLCLRVIYCWQLYGSSANGNHSRSCPVRSTLASRPNKDQGSTEMLIAPAARPRIDRTSSRFTSLVMISIAARESPFVLQTAPCQSLASWTTPHGLAALHQLL